MQLLNEVKEAGEDYEWYPTTDEIIDALENDIKNISRRYDVSYSVLDIGAGNGKVLNRLSESEDIRFSKFFAIEKSRTLVNALSNNIFVIGTDFWQQTLIDKKVDIVFCNPPYSQFEEWTNKIIKEANARFVYLVIPDRWKKNKSIQNTIDLREAGVKTIGSFSFEDAEDRKARARVDLIKISLVAEYNSMYSSKQKVDPFDLWFNETYHFKQQKENEAEDKNKEKRRDIIGGENLIERLETLCNAELEKLNTNYTAIASLDPVILEQMSISKEAMIESMKLNIEGLKVRYWNELFSNMDTITSRLTSKTREKMLDNLRANTSVDFTVDNAYNIVVWAIKNANKYFDEQLLDIYRQMTRRENIVLYKSNKRMISDDWRFLQEDIGKYSLDYRIIMHSYGAVSKEFSYERVNGLSNAMATLIHDIITISNNLGFIVEERVGDEVMVWEPGVKNYFHLSDGTLFAEIKGYKNGNVHMKYNQKFMKALNIEAARLHKWIKTPKEAADEFDMSEAEAVQMFGKNFSLVGSMVPLLGN